MAVNPKTPGVYIDEIPVFPASVAGVATAVPAFIGYVEKAEMNGQGIPLFTPVRITSLLEYETYFGKGDPQVYLVSINDNTIVSPPARTVSVAPFSSSNFKLYYNLQMYFSNGGGPCYIVPVGIYSIGTAATTISKTSLISGLAAIAKVDEPTLLVIPDALTMTSANTKDVYDAALAQCQKLKDRFCITDVKSTGAPIDDATEYRSNTVGVDNLKYGAAYYPYLNTTLGYSVNENQVVVVAQTVNGSAITGVPESITFFNAIEIAVDKLKTGYDNAKIVTRTMAVTGIASYATSIKTALDNLDAAVVAALPGVFKPGGQTAKITALKADVTPPAGAFADACADYVSTANQANADIMLAAYKKAVADILVIRDAAYVTLNTDGTVATFLIGSYYNMRTKNPVVAGSISSSINNYTVTLNPSGAMAGIYARVDADRGVWKAPANVGVRLITGPTTPVTNEQQDTLNVDPTAGKSINVVRAFNGRGTVVWGARTLAGNDNEWRYINVRRLYNYVEESVLKATNFVVFEANTANTWQMVKGMIESFLTGLWRDGALAGATTKEAFFVKVGVGITMTPQDILEGRMIVDVGMAAVRPAEFIVLRFEHKLQES